MDLILIVLNVWLLHAHAILERPLRLEALQAAYFACLFSLKSILHFLHSKKRKTTELQHDLNLFFTIR